MNNSSALLISALILIGFFFAGLFGVLDNFMIKLVLFGTFIGLMVYLIKVNTNKKKLP